MYVHIHTHTHSRVHTHIHKYIFIHTHTHTHTHTQTYTHTDTHKDTHIYTHTHIHAHTHTHTWTHTHTHTHTQTLTHTHTHTCHAMDSKRSCQTFALVVLSFLSARVQMSHATHWMSNVTHMNESCIPSCGHICGWVMPHEVFHTWMSRVHMFTWKATNLKEESKNWSLLLVGLSCEKDPATKFVFLSKLELVKLRNLEINFRCVCFLFLALMYLIQTPCGDLDKYKYEVVDSELLCTSVCTFWKKPSIYLHVGLFVSSFISVFIYV